MRCRRPNPNSDGIPCLKMRVIAGTFRSRQLLAPRGMQTRPTSDRLRETLFNVLAPRLDGCRFVDLYAGTGAVGIEALSRGAAHVWFAENAEPALVALRQNLAALKISQGFTLEDRGVGAMLQRLSKLQQPIDAVFLDPPYEAEDEYSGTMNFFGSVRGRAVLAPHAVVVAEHSGKGKLAMHYGALEHTRLLKQGDAALSFFSLAAEQIHHPGASR
jgi:16S rRNA (guanine966-N2)-methyltransferase